jgi:hypothetical protein
VRQRRIAFKGAVIAAGAGLVLVAAWLTVDRGWRSTRSGAVDRPSAPSGGTRPDHTHAVAGTIVLLPLHEVFAKVLAEQQDSPANRAHIEAYELLEVDRDAWSIIRAESACSR